MKTKEIIFSFIFCSLIFGISTISYADWYGTWLESPCKATFYNQYDVHHPTDSLHYTSLDWWVEADGHLRYQYNLPYSSPEGPHDDHFIFVRACFLIDSHEVNRAACTGSQINHGSYPGVPSPGEVWVDYEIITDPIALQNFVWNYCMNRLDPPQNFGEPQCE